ncbi:hypothetical protein GCM10010191_09840 [Actinomadura vinacea]|uniref:Uncharacterized protein n=1 Tax=Actinomadura vinacea TaxID=115336 RepID=A0ABP5VM43_9ACTN
MMVFLSGAVESSASTRWTTPDSVKAGRGGAAGPSEERARATRAMVWATSVRSPTASAASSSAQRSRAKRRRAFRRRSGETVPAASVPSVR